MLPQIICIIVVLKVLKLLQYSTHNMNLKYFLLLQNLKEGSSEEMP